MFKMNQETDSMVDTKLIGNPWVETPARRIFGKSSLNFAGDCYP